MSEAALGVNLLPRTVHGDDTFPLLSVIRFPQSDVAVIAGGGQHGSEDVPRDSPYVVVVLGELSDQPGREQT